MGIRWNSPEFMIRGEVFLLLALMILLLPLRWVIAFVTAAMWHELCHAAAVYLCGGMISRVTVSGFGAIMDSRLSTTAQELVCTLAGPFGGLILLLFAPVFPRLALCAAAHSFYNLLPMLPLDGGRALRCILQLLIPRHAAAICTGVQWGTRIFVFCITAYFVLAWNLGLLPLLLIVRLLLPNTAKTPCNKALKAVQ